MNYNHLIKNWNIEVKTLLTMLYKVAKYYLDRKNNFSTTCIFRKVDLIRNCDSINNHLDWINRPNSVNMDKLLSEVEHFNIVAVMLENKRMGSRYTNKKPVGYFRIR